LNDHIQSVIDRYYHQHGECCAGCDWWGWHNSLIGDCTRSAPVSGKERYSMLRMENVSMALDAGHIITPRWHKCGGFADTHPWTKREVLAARMMGV